MGATRPAGGVRSLTFFKEELDRCMAFAGTPNLAAIDRGCLQDWGLVYKPVNATVKPVLDRP
jgi:isopentenyl diphosphate isomerase/L-lactate dehydrogenase-like FMN-dependent dehydrogenase